MSSAYAYPGYTNVTAPSESIIPQQPPRTYRLEVAQQPIRARMCGFGEKDRRPIDPPPVVRLIMTTSDGKPIPESSVDPSMFVVHAGLWSNNRKEERSLVINPSSIPTQSTGPSSTVMSLNGPTCTRNLMGSLTSSAYTLTNQHGQQGIYFVFQDLSVRTEGTFTLKFQFADISQLVKRGGPQSQVRVEAEVYSESFTVYSAKKFPGMTESTELSKAFAKQGIKIPIRKETRYRRPHDDVRRVLEGQTPGVASLPVSDHDVDKSDNGDEKDDSENDDDVEENNRSSIKHRTN